MSIQELYELSASLDCQDQWLFNFFNDSCDLMMVVDRNGVMVMVNNMWKLKFGKHFSDVSWLNFVHPDDYNEACKICDELTYCNVNNFTCRMHTQNKTYITVEFSASKYHDGLSNFVGRFRFD
jgi:hypothetical protein